MSEWKPIETAPKDGRDILLSGKKYDRDDTGRWVVLGHWRERSSRFVAASTEDPNADIATPLCNPTHWLCIPPPPEGTK